MSVNPKTPTIPQGQETPPLGQTRATTNGGLEWYDSSTQAWSKYLQANDTQTSLKLLPGSAVRQTAIRDRLLRRAKEQEGNYGKFNYYLRKNEVLTDAVYPRGKGSGNNETAPLREDLNYGPNWANRPALLFQLEPTGDQRCVEPTGVLMYNDHVMLDPFDHPIRNFGRDLPIVLSTELKGDEVEHYLRKNLAMKVYDLICMYSPAKVLLVLTAYQQLECPTDTPPEIRLVLDLHESCQCVSERQSFVRRLDA